MAIETAIKLHQTGVWLVLASAIILVVTTTLATRFIPRLVLPFLVVAWITGLAGFAAVCWVQPSFINIALGVLFLASAGFHGWRIAQRVRASSENPACCDDPTHHHTS